MKSLVILPTLIGAINSHIPDAEIMETYPTVNKSERHGDADPAPFLFEHNKLNIMPVNKFKALFD